MSGTDGNGDEAAAGSARDGGDDGEAVGSQPSRRFARPGPAGRAALHRLLTLPRADVDRIRRAAGPRRRPRRQVGPTADYGGPADGTD